MVGINSGYIASLPAPVKRRLKALKRYNWNRPRLKPNSMKKYTSLNANIMKCISLYMIKGLKLLKVIMNPTMTNVNGQAMKRMTNSLVI